MTRVLVVLSHIRDTTFSYELSERIALADDLDVTVVSYYDASPAEAALAPETNVELIPLGAESRTDPAAIRHLRWVLTTGEYDVLHTHHNFVGSLARLLAPRHIAIVDTEHADHKEHYSLPQVLVNLPTLPRADRIVANSAQTLRSLYAVERLLTRGRLGVIYNGIDVARIDRAIAIPENPYEIAGARITCVGRFSETKNQSLLLRAFASVASTDTDVRLTLVGDGPLRSDLEALARSLGVRDAVEFTGFIERDAVYQLLAASDLYVQPSLSEGFCMAVVEAMACRLPVVVSDIDVFDEIVGDAGAVANPRRPEAFAKQLRDLLADTDRATALADRAYERARSRFPLEKTAAEYRSLYRELADGHSTR
ncbi:glycosyltransferase family 4 protein [Natronococcus occultus]|uniref:Glycosyltransferase n=1 Tax=Natronococcus occultus SP4 TaxID=694430 RepID=L0K402_9EURY|nr:glycosyltransferase family 4 protein [Natronococcus occultus]AGB38813.1 glycosyltransferase [Natronococcus occultus SP4]